MSLREVQGPLRRWSEAGKRAAVATLVAVRRSAPRPPGARFAVNEDGEVAGSVSSGCVEGDLHERLVRIIQGEPAALVRYGITDEMAAGVGLACGGEIDVLLTAHDPRSPVGEALAAAVERAEPVVLLTGISEPIRGRQLLLRREADGRGGLGSEELNAAAAAAAARLFESSDARILELSPGARGTSGAEEPIRLFAESFLPAPRLAIVGSGPIAVALSRMASCVGWRVWVVDPRETFADPDRYPDAEAVLHTWPEEGLEAIGLDPYLDVVVLAHDRKLDLPALAAALRAGCLYVGQIGGRRTQEERRRALRELGFGNRELERIRGPVGLEIGARSPPEIAVSILAEMISAGRGPGRRAG